MEYRELPGIVRDWAEKNPKQWAAWIREYLENDGAETVNDWGAFVDWVANGYGPEVERFNREVRP